MNRRSFLPTLLWLPLAGLAFLRQKPTIKAKAPSIRSDDLIFCGTGGIWVMTSGDFEFKNITINGTKLYPHETP